MLTRLTTLAAALLVSTALNAEPVTGGRANVVIQPEPPSLMMGLVQNGPTQMVAGQIYEGLLRYDQKLQPMPQLAKSWDVSEDGLTYTFHLHDNVKWHDGKPFTSADVVFSADVFLRETHARLRTSLEHVESITAPDDTTVIFKLKEPFGPFLGIFEAGTMPMVPKHIYEGTEYKSNPANNTPIGTGPFKFKEWVKGSHILLTKNEDYYEEGKPYLDEIYWHIIPDAASRAVAYETGVVDILPGGSIENFDVQRVSEMENTCITDKGWEYFGPLSWMWLNNREGPTADKRFRQAVMYAMDRNFARDALWNGLGKVAKGPVSSSTRFFSDEVTNYDYDPEKAKALLAEMGYKGETVRLLPLPYGETWQRWAEAVKQNLDEVGINVELVSTDVAGWNQKLAEWDYDIAFTYLYQYGDPALGVARTYLSTNIAKGSQWNNVEGYDNKEVDALFDKAAVAVTAEERQKLYTEVQQKLVDDVPVAWLLELGFPTIYRCNVKDLVTTAIGVNDGFKNAYIEK
ncbi:ABC transporter substrate binding protein [Nitratireductor indicus C115]|uniref:ABC transporter substrate binding protein n=1 Tax=Nitratireductor indicus C115 TaxID=1231190 RepID=K2PPG1_9HYPH|nr:ABC transporter substrate-binding protein [Nitratireductor indicus]EKF42967.1 ABC transporter substrate binding protein [Nitratireductor indicus C115]SFQ51551.1 peptide/nickel transport system substrate-binding protein [Nitratireductor indicus]